MGTVLPEGPWYGLLVIALTTVGLSALVGAVLYQHELVRSARRAVRRLRPLPERPSVPPIERIALDARRLRAEMRTQRSGTPMARRVGISQAYDDVLVDACLALGVPDTLSDLGPGIERESERLHVENKLEAAGLRLSA